MAFKQPDTLTVTTGTLDAGDVDDLALQDGTRVQVSSAAGVLLVQLDYQLDAAALPDQFRWVGQLTGSNDSVAIQAFDWRGSSWETVQTVTGSNDSANVTRSIPLLERHIGLAANLGQVRIRFSGTGLSTADLFMDQALIELTLGRTGYEDGAVWVDTVNGVAGTLAFLNGTQLDPVDSLADALTIAASLNVRRIRVLPGSTLTAASAVEGYELIGLGFSVNLGGQSWDGSAIQGADGPTGVQGTWTGELQLFQCDINGITGTDLRAERCGLKDTSNGLVASGAGEMILHLCFSEVPGTGTPEIDLNGQAAGILQLRGYSGGVEVKGMVAGAVASLDFIAGQVVINADCSGGTMAIRGTADLTDNSGNVTLAQDARLDLDGIWGFTVSEPSGVFSWTTGTILELLSWLGVLAKHKLTQTADTMTVRNDADDASLATAPVSSAAGTFTRGELS